jgi:hypothetical protein
VDVGSCEVGKIGHGEHYQWFQDLCPRHKPARGLQYFIRTSKIIKSEEKLIILFLSSYKVLRPVILMARNKK